uniref:SDR family oxidoreductase n=1 Tax=Mesorhizobium caraganae TaxID=483206 RepID=UPI001785131D
MKEDEEQRTPLRQAGTPEQMSEVALFFLTEGSNITGQNIVVDAGGHLGLLPKPCS